MPLPIQKGRLELVAADQLTLNPVLQMRAAGTDPDHAETLSQVVKAKKGSLPRVQVREVAADDLPPGCKFTPVTRRDGRVVAWLVTDGFHTVTGHRLAGKKNVQVNIRPGSWLDAVIDAAGANQTKLHQAMYRTKADKRLAVERLVKALRDEGVNWTTGKIAAQCGVSPDLAERVKAELYPLNGETNGHAEGADGRTYKPRAKKPAGVQADAWRATPVEEWLDLPEKLYEAVEARAKTAGEVYDLLEGGDDFGLKPLQKGNLYRQVIGLRDAGKDAKGGNQPAPARGKEPHAVWREADPALGAVYRLPDRVVAEYPGEKGSADFLKAERLLGEFSKVVKAWRERLTKDQPKG